LQPPNDVYRVARKPDPWALLDWRWVHDDGTFYNRYDDPKAKYRVLYASTQALFEPVAILAKRTEALKADDPDLVKALEILKLSF